MEHNLQEVLFNKTQITPILCGYPDSLQNKTLFTLTLHLNIIGTGIINQTNLLDTSYMTQAMVEM